MFIKARSILVVIVAGLIVLFAAAPAFCQPFEGRQGQQEGPQKRGGFRKGMVRGEVVSIEEDNFVISVQDGQTKTIAVSRRTKFSKPIRIGEDELEIGANVFVIGQLTQDGSIRAKMIRVLPERKKRNKPSQRPTQQLRPIDRNAREGMQGNRGQAGGRGNKQGVRPIRGKITSLEPLTVKGKSGKAKIVKVTSNTRIMKENPVSYSDLREGDKVIVIIPPFGRKTNEARRVEILSAEQASRIGSRPVTTGSLSDLP